MPYFNYSCDGCGEEFEALTQQNGSDVECPACGGGRLTRQISSRVAMVTGARHTGRVMDLSSGACPGCAHHNHRH